MTEFVSYLEDISYEIGFRVSSRGWAYLLEGRRLINKDQFDKVTNLINKCRKEGYLPIDFVAEESARAFTGVETPNERDVVAQFGQWVKMAGDIAEYYTPDWWEGEEYYIQMVVEKIDLVTLFEPVCRQFHVPIANSKGWSSMLQRAEYARRFAEAEEKGLKCVLLYCGDHDPDGLRIAQFIKKNLADLKDVTWGDDSEGYDPSNLIIKRFGLSYEFIQENNLTWIDNLVTGSGNILARQVGDEIIPGIIMKGKNAGKPHQNFYMPYMQEYLADYGCRKCEANAMITMPESARELVKKAITDFIGEDSEDRFEVKRQEVRDELNEFMEETGFQSKIDEIVDIIDNR